VVRGRMIFPDTHFDGNPGDWQWVYTVRFAAREVWGDAADANASVAIDLWEAYLDPA
jgi:nitrile hydratase